VQDAERTDLGGDATYILGRAHIAGQRMRPPASLGSDLRRHGAHSLGASAGQRDGQAFFRKAARDCSPQPG
jgi:hypothetical protein